MEQLATLGELRVPPDTRPPSTPFVDPRDAVGATIVDPAAGPGGDGAIFTLNPGAFVRPDPYPPSVTAVTDEELVEPVALTPLGGPPFAENGYAIADADAGEAVVVCCAW